MDTKATVHIGDYSRGGRSREVELVKALDHDIRTYALMTTVNYANCRCWCFGYDTVEDANFKAFCDSQMHLADVHGIFDE